MKRYLLPLFLFSTAVSSQAALTITDASFSGSVGAGTPETLNGVATLTSITTSEGTFTALTGATSSNAAGERFWKTTDPAVDSSAVLGLTASDGLLNLTSATTTFQLGSAFTADTRFFILDATSLGGGVGDSATITFIDSAGAAVGTYTYSMLAASFGAMGTSLATLPSASREVAGATGLQLNGISFSLADFAGSGDLSTATGIQLTSASGLDPAVVGIYTVPEPGSVILTACGGLAMAFVRRRSSFAEKLKKPLARPERAG